ncbi:MAG: DUF6582 domain-containing protein [Chloroflexota bacterium]
MAELDTRQRDKLRASSFAYIDGEGERHLPINDAAHVRNAIARFGQTDFESQKARYAAARLILSAARRHDIEVGDDAEVMRVSRS